MQSRSSYLQSLKAQLEPSVRGQLAKLIENFDEEVKKSDSRARKILALFISAMASFQLAKKTAENALLAALHIERMVEKSRHEKSLHAKPVTLEEEEETVDSSITPNNAVSKLSEQLNEIYAKQRVLDEQYTQNMEQIDLLEKEAFSEALSKNMGVPFTEKETAELMNIYKNKPVSTENMFKQFIRAITPSLEPTPGAQKKDDVDTKEVAEARAHAIKRLQKVTPERIAQSSSLTDQIKTIGRLREMAPTAPLRSVLTTGNAIDGVIKKFQPIREALKKAFEEARDHLNTQLKGCLDALGRVKDMLAKPFIAATVSTTPSIDPTPAPSSAPTPSPKH